MAQRKTIEVDKVRQMLNGAIASAPTAEERQALGFVAEWVLMESGNYGGFRYTDGNFGLMDSSRRHYYLKGGTYDYSI